MAYLYEHCADCRRLLGNEWKGIPSQADYESGQVNVNGFTPESTEADVALLLDEIRDKKS